MLTRTARFFNAVSHCQHEPISAVTTDRYGWKGSTAALTHARSGQPMAYAWRQVTGSHGFHPQRGSPSTNVALVVTAVRVGADAASVEVSAGLTIDSGSSYGHLDDWFLASDTHGKSGLVYCYDTAPAYLNTCRIPVKWTVAGTAPNINLVRGVPRVGHIREHVIHLTEQMTPQWGEGAGAVPEAVLSNPQTFASTDKVTLGIPWVSEFNEAPVTFPINDLKAAVAKVKQLVTPK